MSKFRDDWPLWLAALLGVGSLAFTKKYGIPNYYLGPILGKRPRTVLSLYTDPQAPGWENTLDKYDALSMRLLGPQATPDKSAYYALADQAGIARHGWGYQFLNSKEQADRELGRLEVAIPMYGIEMYWANPEKEFNAQPNAIELAEYFVAQFRERFPGVGLGWNGFGGLSGAAAASWGIGKGWESFCKFVNMWDVWAPMTYATCPATVEGKIRNSADAALKCGMAGKYGPYVRVGEDWRSEKAKGSCLTWGYAYGPGGLIALNEEYKFPWVLFYHGSIGKDSTLIQGNQTHKNNPSIPDLIDMLHGKKTPEDVAGIV